MGLPLEEIAVRTRINLNYLQAIEEDTPEVIPGGFFFRAFVRQYAQAVGLPDDFGKYELEVMIREDEVAEKEKEAIPREPSYSVPPIRLEGVLPATETKKWALGMSLLTVVLVACSLAYALWERYRNSRLEAKAETAQQQQQQRAVPPPAQQQTPDTAATQPTPDPNAGTSSLPPANAGDSPASANPPPPAPAAQTATPPQTAASEAIHLVIKANENVWVEATSEGKRLFSDVIKAGSSQEFTSSTPIRIKLGNAGGVQIDYNGVAIPPLGPRGMVRTTTFRKDGYDVPPAQ